MKTKLKPVYIIPFELYDIKPFICDVFPRIFPDSPDYKKFWLPQAQSCIEGKWGLDSDGVNGGYRYMTGPLYFYRNFGIIDRTAEGNTQEGKNPLLRDIDWLLFYDLICCEGFSGFEGDTEISCFRPLGKLQRGEELNEREEIRMKLFEDKLRKADGKYKRYMPATEYLYQTFDKPMGLPMYDNTALDGMLFSTRRLGKSLGYGNGIVIYDMVFNGARTLSDFLEKKTKTNVTVGAEVYSKTEELLTKLYATVENLRKNVGAYREKDYSYNGVFYHPWDGWTKEFLASGGIVTNSVPSISGKGRKGVGSRLNNVSFRNNKSAAAGTGARKVLIEEGGLIEDYIGVLSETSPTQVADFKFGYTITIGTGGDIKKIKGIKSFFYNPDENDILSFPNLFEKSEKRIARFVPVYYKNNDFRDKNGNLNVEASFNYELKVREKKKKTGRYQNWVLSYPFLPSEMFMQADGNIFPTEHLEETFRELSEWKWESTASLGTLTYVDKDNRKVVWNEDVYGRLNVISEYLQEDSMKKGDGKSKLESGIIVYEHPIDNLPNRYTNNPLYLACYDPVAITFGDGTSLACVIVFKTWNFDNTNLQMNVVAESYFRVEGDMDAMHNRAFMMADYYGCRLLPETNNEDILRYAKRIKRWNDLEDYPAFSAAEIIKKTRNHKKGFKIPSSRTAKEKLLEYTLEWLVTEVDSEQYIEGDKIITNNKLVCNEIPSKRLAEEFIHFYTEGNFDGVSTCILFALWIRNRELKPKTLFTDLEETKKIGIHEDFLDTSARLEYNPAFNY